MRESIKSLLKKVVQLNGPMMIKLEGNELRIIAYEKEVALCYDLIDIPIPIEEVPVHSKNENAYLVTSDIFDVIDYEVFLPNFSEEIVRDYITELLVNSIQFIGKIIESEGVAVLMQSTYIKEAEYLVITIGLLNDARIIFCELKKGEKN